MSERGCVQLDKEKHRKIKKTVMEEKKNEGSKVKMTEA
jgi:hypothetical protein